MTLAQLEYFRKTAQLQHFTHAAEALRISQPSLSASLAALERELGVPLFERSGRGILLTQAGTVLLGYASRILHDVDAARQTMSDLSLEHETLIRIGYIAPLGQSFVPRTLRRFQETPQGRSLRFLLESDTTRALKDRLRQDAYDFILCTEMDADPDIAQTLLMEQPIVLITPHGHPLAERVDAGGPGVTLAESLLFPLVSYQENSRMTTLVHRLYTLHDLHPEIRYRAPDEQTIASLVAEGFGIAAVARVEQLDQARVRILPFSDATMSRRICIAYRKNRKLSAAALRLMKFMMDAVEPEHGDVRPPDVGTRKHRRIRQEKTGGKNP